MKAIFNTTELTLLKKPNIAYDYSVGKWDKVILSVDNSSTLNIGNINSIDINSIAEITLLYENKDNDIVKIIPIEIIVDTAEITITPKKCWVVINPQ